MYQKAAAISVLTFFILSCSSGSEKLPSPETFPWKSGRPISFSRPPSGWESSRYQNGCAEPMVG
jgi:hypothetical protein